jgi:surface polysaccharide O-acyltransferase-like enzyme
LKSPLWVRGAARIARQPSKLNAVGSNPTGPATTTFGKLLCCRLNFISANTVRETASRWTKLNQQRKLSVPVDLIRTVAIVAVIVLHATRDATSFQPEAPLEVWRWWIMDIYQSLSRVGVPLFVMLSGALLLQPSKIEPLNDFFKKRWARIGLPFLFWGAIYFAWDFFANQEAFTSSFIVQGVLSGPYFHFWYLYMLIGLYIFTPVLRVVVTHVDRKTFKYFLIAWLLGPLLMQSLSLFGYTLDSNLLTIPWWLGYYLLGVYMLNVRVRRRTLLSLSLLGLALTAVGTYFMAATFGGTQTYFFQDYFSPTMILASVTLFLLLKTVQAPQNQTEPRHPKISLLLRKISENTLPLYLFHVMIIESLQRGYFSFTISSSTLNSIVEVPLISFVALFICLAVIVPLKKIPGLKRLIG